MIYTYVNMYIAFLTPVMGARDQHVGGRRK